MKKITIILCTIFTIGLVSSCSKDSSVKPASIKIQKTISSDRTDVGSGD